MTAIAKDGSSLTTSRTKVTVGSKIRITFTLTYQIPSGWTWTPSIVVKGVDGKSENGWVRNNPSTYIYEGVVEGAVSISCDDEFANSFKEVNIEILSSPSLSSGDSMSINGSDGMLIKSQTISISDGWKYIFENLPLVGTENGESVNYYYYVEEVSVPNYTTSYENNGGIQSGTITVINKADDNPEITLPETGGPGTKLYTIGGMLLMACAGFLLMYNKKRRKEDMASS